jgi:hypothetical protein
MPGGGKMRLPPDYWTTDWSKVPESPLIEELLGGTELVKERYRRGQNANEFISDADFATVAEKSTDDGY